MIYGIREAAVYLGLSVSTLKYHIYQSGDLQADQVVGGRLIFTQETLDAFAANKRPSGRPRK